MRFLVKSATWSLHPVSCIRVTSFCLILADFEITYSELNRLLRHNGNAIVNNYSNRYNRLILITKTLLVHCKFFNKLSIQSYNTLFIYP